MTEDENEGVWVVRWMQHGKKFYICRGHNWDSNLSMAKRFNHRDDAVLDIARELKDSPKLWDEIVPVRLVKKKASS